MEEGEEQEPDLVTTEQIFNMISDVDAVHEDLKKVEWLQYKLKYSRKVVEYAEQKFEKYRDLLRKSDSENYELKKSKITLDQHNKLLKELNDLKAEHHNLVNWAEIRYQKVNQELIAATDKYKALEKEYNELKEHSQGQILQSTKPSRTKTKKSKEVKVQLPQENESEESQKLADLEEVLRTERNQIKELTSKLNDLEKHHQNKIETLNNQLQNEIKENNNNHQKMISTLNEQLRNKDTEIKDLIEKLHLKIKLPKENTETKVLNNQLKNEMRENNNKYQKMIDTLKDQLKNKDTENEKLVEELNSLQLQINLLKEDTVLVNSGMIQAEKCSDANISMLCSDLDHHNNIEICNLQPQFEDTDRGNTSDPPTDEINSIFKDMRHHSKLISPLLDLEPTQNKNMQIPKPITELQQVQNKSLKVSTISLNRKFNMKVKELNVINKRLCVSRRKLTVSQKECCLQNKELFITKKELRLIKNELCMTKKKLLMLKRYTNLKRPNQKCNRVYNDQGTQCSETSNNKEELPPVKRSLPQPVSMELPPPKRSPSQPDMTKIEKKVLLHQLKIKKNLKQQLLDDLRKWHTDSFLSYPSAESDVESGLSHSTLRRKKFRKQRQKQISHDSSDEDTVVLDKENVQKKAGKLDEKSTKPASDLISNNAEAEQDIDFSETIYAKAQGSVDSGYVKTDSGGESDVQSRKRKNQQNSNEISKKKKHTSSKSQIQEAVPENPADCKHWTRSMVKLFGTDSESYSSCLEANTQKEVTNMVRKPKVKYLQRVECERSDYFDRSSDSDLLIGFANGFYSSIPKKDVPVLSQLNIAPITKRNANTPIIAQKQRRVTRQKQETPCKQLNINLIIKDLNLSEDYLSTCTETEAKTRNPLLEDGTESLTCKVISVKPPLATRRSVKKNKPCVQPSTKMVLRSANMKTDDESAKSSSDCRTSFKSIFMRKQQKPTTCIVQETELTHNVGKKRIAHTLKHERVIESTDSENGQLIQRIAHSPKRNENKKAVLSDETSWFRKRKVNNIVRKTTEMIKVDYSKRQNNDSFLNTEGEEVGSCNNPPETIVENCCEEATISSDEYPANGKKRRISSRIAGIKGKSKTDDEKSIISSDNSGNKGRVCRFGVEKFGTTDKSGIDDEKPITNSEHFETTRRTSRISPEKCGTHIKSGTDDDKSVTVGENIGRGCRISVGKFGNKSKSGTDNEKPIITSENSGNKDGSCRISAGKSATNNKSGTDKTFIINNEQNTRTRRISPGKPGTNNKSRTDVGFTTNSEHSESTSRTHRISPEKPGTNNKSGTDDDKSITDRENIDSAGKVGTEYKSGTDVEEPIITSENSENKGRACRISAGKSANNNKFGTDETLITNNEQTTRTRRISPRKPGTNKKSRTDVGFTSNSEHSDSTSSPVKPGTNNKSGTDDDKSVTVRENIDRGCRISAGTSGINNKSGTGTANNEHSQTTSRTRRISPEKRGTNNKSGTDDDKSVTIRDNIDRECRISAGKSGTNNKSGTLTANSEHSAETTSRTRRISPEKRGTNNKSGTDDDKSVTIRENIDRRCRISAGTSGINNKSGTGTANNEHSQTTSRTRRISPEKRGTNNKSGTDDDKSVTIRENIDRRCRISAGTSGINNKSGTGTANNEHSQTTSRTRRISPEKRGTNNKSGTDDDKSVTIRENIDRRCRISAGTSGINNKSGTGTANNEHSQTTSRTRRISPEKRGTNNKSGTDDDKSVTIRDNIDRECRISAGKSGTNNKTGTLTANSEHSAETTSRTRRISPEKRGTNNKSGTDDDKPVTVTENIGRGCRISVGKFGNKSKSGTDDEKPIITIKNSGNKDGSCRISAGKSATNNKSGTDKTFITNNEQNTRRTHRISPGKPGTNNKSRTDVGFTTNSEHSESTSRTCRISSEKPGTNNKSGTDDDKSITDRENIDRGCRISAGKVGTEYKSRTDDEEPIITSENSENKGRACRISAGKSATNNKSGTDETFITNNEQTTRRTRRISPGKPGTNNKSRTDVGFTTNSEHSESTSRIRRISPEKPGTNNKSGTDDDKSITDRETIDRGCRISAGKVGTEYKSGTDDEPPIITSENFENKGRPCRIRAGKSATNNKSEAVEETFITYNEHSETTRKTRRISPEKRGTSIKSGIDDDKSVIVRENIDREYKISVGKFGTNCKSGTDDEKPVVTSENSENKDGAHRISAGKSATNNKSRTDESFITYNEHSETTRRTRRNSPEKRGTNIKSGTDDEKSVTVRENMGRGCRISVGKLGTECKSGIADKKPIIITSENSENKSSARRISVGKSSTNSKSGTDEETFIINSEHSETTWRISPGKTGTNNTSGTDEGFTTNNEHSETTSKTRRISPEKPGSNNKSGTDDEKPIITSENSRNKDGASRISGGKSEINNKSGTDDEKAIVTSKNSGNKGRVSSISGGKTETNNKSGTMSRKRSRTKGEECGSSSDEHRTNFKTSCNGSKKNKFSEEKIRSINNKLGGKRYSLRKSESSDEKPDLKNIKSKISQTVSKLSDNHLMTNSLTNEQLLARKRVVEVLKLTTSPTKSNKQTSFKRPNTRKIKLESHALLNPDPNIAIMKSSVVLDLDLKVAAVSQNATNFNTKDQLTKAFPTAITLEPNVLPHPDEKNATLESPDLPAPESPDLPNPDSLDFESPASPNPECENQKICDVGPRIIPLEEQDRTSWQAKSILNQLLHYCKSDGMAQEVANALLCENPYLIAKLVLEVISQDIHAKIEIFNYRRAPLLTITQRLMLGLLLDLEEKGLKGVINSFLNQAEQFLITLKDPLHISPTARLHAAFCKMQFDYKRMRLMLCKAVFFMGDVAIPYLYIVLCSWLELIPLNNDNLSGHDALEARTLVQLIRLKQCAQPEYNLHNLQTLLKKYHGYSFDREDSEKLLQDLFKCYIGKNRSVLEDVTSESVMYLTVALCESLDKKFVFKQIDKLKIRLVVSATNDEMYGVIYLVGIITFQYCEDKEVSADVCSNREWLQQFCADSYPEYINKAAMDVIRKI